MGDFGNGFSGGDLNGNGRFDGGDYEIWKDIEHSSKGGYSGSGLGEIIGWFLIICGIFLTAIFPPCGILIWIGAKMLS